RFTDRAVKYRMHIGFREIDTPMAVLFMPMIEPVAAGVVYTSDMEHPDANTLVINAVPGLANKMVKGEVQADTIFISKGSSLNIQKSVPATGIDDAEGGISYIHKDTLLEIAALSIKAADIAGYDLDIEWAVDANGKIWLLQERRLNIPHPDGDAVGKPAKKKNVLPILEGGMTIFPGRAEGPVRFLENDADVSNVPEGAVVVAEKPRPELAVILPKIAALLVIEGNPVGHLATLVREFSVPCIFRLGQSARLLFGTNVISVNATKRTVYTGVRWPGMRERVLARIASKGRHKKSGPLYDLVLKLTLLDPDAPSFKPKSCTSIHDTLRFMHEMAVRSMFGFGDTHKRGWHKKTRELQTNLPIKFQIMDLDDSVPANVKKVKPEDVASKPFNALWKGISDKRLHWPDRWKKEMMGMPLDFREAVLGGNRGPRRTSDKNYVIVAKDYLNINARMAYHYAMVDAMVGPGTENNHVHFRFRGGGAGDENRIRRARFLESILRQSGFGVEQQGDLVTAWLRRHSQKESENSLETLGRLMVCARQLDAALRNDADIKRYAEYFFDEKYAIFS
ncbi:MAG: pyruvate, water dikinase, partial [Desulfobacteraceae bacterium]|nr:pyruvate, water dikinase [Desulfobacteraceae bacterium]